ncbi:MAG: peptidase S8 [Candidatus Moranbacteria bacterium CG23_combo_of_CG06-09_8_20_14_all_39_10]|nr:MAG: peptidase S8 [Candidatus Moranbacteria bacterium CG23_combo_of_CG06-09_8_20_14_all_39_10]
MAFVAGSLAAIVWMTKMDLQDSSLAKNDASVEKVAKGRVMGTSKEHVLVKFRDNVIKEKKDEFFAKNQLKEKFEIKQIGIKAVVIPEGKTPEEMVEKIKNENKDIIEFAEADALLEPALIPNDPQYPSQWHHAKINSPAAWDSANGSVITIAVMDTGVDCTHPDLANSCVAGWNVVSGNNDTTDIYGHGTRVAGSAAAIGNNNNQVAGVAYAAKIMPMRITNDSAGGYAYFSDIAKAITWAADHGARVANASYSASGGSTVQSAAQYMKSKGGLVTMSAGNAGANTNLNAVSQVITVSATDSSDVKTSWSSFGNDVDVAAPGLGILSTSRGGGTSSVSGTSFSAPITAGVVGLIFSANPNLTPDQAQKILFDSAKDLGSVGWDNYYGWGRVDAGAAVALARSGQTIINNPINTVITDIVAPVVKIINLLNGATVSGTVAITGNASDNVEVAMMEVYIDGVKISSVSASTISYSWNTRKVSIGPHVILVKAYDAAMNMTSQAVNVTVANAGNKAKKR